MPGAAVNGAVPAPGIDSRWIGHWQAFIAHRRTTRSEQIGSTKAPFVGKR